MVIAGISKVKNNMCSSKDDSIVHECALDRFRDTLNCVTYVNVLFFLISCTGGLPTLCMSPPTASDWVLHMQACLSTEHHYGGESWWEGDRGGWAIVLGHAMKQLCLVWKQPQACFICVKKTTNKHSNKVLSTGLHWRRDALNCSEHKLM